MVATIPKARIKPTKEEAAYLIEVSPRIAWHGENVPCPRCGKTLIYTVVGSSSSVSCSDDECISTDCRGI